MRLPMHWPIVAVGFLAVLCHGLAPAQSQERQRWSAATLFPSMRSKHDQPLPKGELPADRGYRTWPAPVVRAADQVRDTFSPGSWRRAAPSVPSFLHRMAEDTRAFFVNVSEVVWPFGPKSDPRQAPYGASPPRRGAWWKPSGDRPQRPNSVAEFLAQPRP